MGGTGPETTGTFAGNSATSDERAAKSGAISARSRATGVEHVGEDRPGIDPRLARLIDAWDTLDEETRDAIIALVEAAG
jgi:hypothetical protein